MNRFRLRRIMALFLGICLLLGTLTGLSSCAGRREIVLRTEVTEVLLNKAGDRITVSATLSAEDAAKYKNATLCLFALEPFETTAEAESGRLKPLAESRGSESMRFTVDFVYDSGMRNRLCQRFLLASRNEDGTYTAVTEGVYLTNPEMLSDRQISVDAETLKGVALSCTDDVTSLAPTHAIIDLPIEQYLCAAPKNGETISYIYAGETLSVSESAIEALDAQMEALRAHGTRIYLRPMLTTAPETLGALSVLGDMASAEAHAYSLNFRSADGYFYIAGLFSFLAERYPTVAGVIPGLPINDATFHATSIADSDTYRTYAVTLLRTVYNIFRSKNAGVRVYLPVNNLYTTDAPVFPTEEDVRNFLSAFAAYAKKTGDFDWSVYVRMDLPNTATGAIYQESGTVNVDAVTEKYLLPQTVGQLTDLLSNENMLYSGSVRGMMWGISLPGNNADATDLETQGMSLLYTYMKALAMNNDTKSNAVHAVIWETLMDEEACEDGLIRTDGSLKPAGELFCSLGRADLASVIDLAAVQAAIGAHYADISVTITEQIEHTKLYTGKAISAAQTAEETESVLLFGENAGWGDAFKALPGNGTLASKRPQHGMAPMLKATFESGLGSGIYTNRIASAQLKNRNHLVVPMTALLPEGHPSAKVLVTLDGTSDGESCRYIGSGEIAHNVWETMVFDISAFASEIDGESVTMTLSLIGTGSTSETPTELYLSKIEVRETQNWFVRGGWVLFPVILILIAMTVLLIWFFHTYEVHWTPNRKKKEKRPEKKKKKDSEKPKRKTPWSALSERTQIRPRTRARIMVKPDSKTSEPESNDFDAELRDAEELEELFDADPTATDAPLFDDDGNDAEEMETSDEERLQNEAEQIPDVEETVQKENVSDAHANMQVKKASPSEQPQEPEASKVSAKLEKIEEIEELEEIKTAEKEPLEEISSETVVLSELDDLPDLDDEAPPTDPNGSK